MAASRGFVLEQGPVGTTVAVTGDSTGELAAILAAGRADGLVLNYACGFRERSLEFLRGWPIRRLDVPARTVSDIEPVYRLAGTLEELGLTTSPRATLDCARLPHLRSLSAEDWGQIRQSLPLAGGLQRLSACGYPESDLAALSGNSDLRSIMLKHAPHLERLTGIETLPHLDSLHIAGAHQLHDLAPLRGHQPRLRTLGLETCGAITSLDDIAGQASLRELWIANCGPVDSLAPVAALRELTRLHLWESTRITDGDLTPLLHLPKLSDLRIMNRRHYQPSAPAIKARLGIRE